MCGGVDSLPSPWILGYAQAPPLPTPEKGGQPTGGGKQRAGAGLLPWGGGGCRALRPPRHPRGSHANGGTWWLSLLQPMAGVPISAPARPRGVWGNMLGTPTQVGEDPSPPPRPVNDPCGGEKQQGP